jgi:hypothetical protein
MDKFISIGVEVRLELALLEVIDDSSPAAARRSASSAPQYIEEFAILAQMMRAQAGIACCLGKAASLKLRIAQGGNAMTVSENRPLSPLNFHPPAVDY